MSLRSLGLVFSLVLFLPQLLYGQTVRVGPDNLSQFVSMQTGVCYLRAADGKHNLFGRVYPQLVSGARFKAYSKELLSRLLAKWRLKTAALAGKLKREPSIHKCKALQAELNKIKLHRKLFRSERRRCLDYRDVPSGRQCGNNVKEQGEVCDGIDLAGQTCETLGYQSGSLGCNADCSAFSTRRCVPLPGPCENGIQDPGEENVDCGGRCPLCQSSVAQYGVTWVFDRGYRVWEYANGDFGVLGPVTITRIEPDYDGTHHGWEANPKDFVKQGFDVRVYHFDAGLVPSLPYYAGAGTSIVKAISNDPAVPKPQCSYNVNRVCYLKTAAVLTVADRVPPGGGALAFRPPYFGSEKPVYWVNQLNTELLPAVAPVDNAPTLESVEQRFQRVQLDHKRDWVGRSMHPEFNLPDYGGDIALDNGDGALRLMLNDPLEAKLPALINYVQMGIDLGAVVLNGGSFPPNGGHGSGRKLPIAMAAVLLDIQALKDTLRNASRQTFQEDGSIYFSQAANGGAGAVLFGQNGDYWYNQVTDGGSRTAPDPYGYIDGGHVPGESYQRGINSMIWKGPVIAMQLMPEIAELWPTKDDFIAYVDRWVTFGPWAQPDPCAPVMGICVGGENDGRQCTYANLNACPNGYCAGGICDGGPYNGAPCSDDGGPSPEHDCGKDSQGRSFRCKINPAYFGVTYGPDPHDPKQCILDTDPSDGIGRHPYNHGRNPNQGGYHSPFVDRMWDAYRLYHCFNGVQDQDEEGVDCGGSCVFDKDLDGYLGRICNHQDPRYDCDDFKAYINPGRPEICTQQGEFDDDCDGRMHASYYLDTDRDGINDCQDNCPLDCNADQADRDYDGRGDACDDVLQLYEDFESLTELGQKTNPGGLSFDIISGQASLGSQTHWGYISKFLRLAGVAATANLVVTKEGRGQWSDYRMHVLTGQKYTTGGFVLHYKDSLNYYLINLRSGKMEKVQNGQTFEIAGSGDAITMPWGGANADYTIESIVDGSVTFIVTKDGSAQRSFVDSSPHTTKGSIGFFERGYSSGNYFIFDNVEMVFENGYSGPHGTCR